VKGASDRLEDQELLMLSRQLLHVSLVYVNTLMIEQVLADERFRAPCTTCPVSNPHFLTKRIAMVC
jgi:TnpA family transposase